MLREIIKKISGLTSKLALILKMLLYLTVLKQLNIHMQKNEVGLLPHTIYEIN